MAWQYNEPGVKYDQVGLEYNSGILSALFEWIRRARRRRSR